MKPERRANIALSGLLALLLLAGAADWQIREPARREVRSDGATAGLPEESRHGPAAPSATVQLFDAAAVLPAVKPAPPARPVSPAAVAARAEKAPSVEPVPAPPAPRPRDEAGPKSEPKPRATEPPAAPPPQKQTQPQTQPEPPAQAGPDQTPPAKTTAAPTSPPAAGGLKPGQYPPLVVEFDSIGFERYARITEQAGGAFFAYIGGEGLGPRVSLSGREPAASGPTADLATERPYLVSDPAVGERLAPLDLGERASRSSVVMLWPRWLDARAWDAIEAALREEKIPGDRVMQVDARLLEAGGRALLRIEGFTLQPDGQARRLASPRTVRIGS